MLKFFLNIYCLYFMICDSDQPVMIDGWSSRWAYRQTALIFPRDEDIPK